jgi:hypothetical protein
MTIEELQKLAGVNKTPKFSEVGSNISITGTEKKRLERELNIQPGTDEWFQLWFSLPYLTGEKAVQFRGRKK